MPKKERIPLHLQQWIEAHRRHRLSHAHVQMARELGMNPKKLGKLDNHRQEPWKAPLPIFIESIYFKRFGRERPSKILTIKEAAAAQAEKKRAKKLARQARKAARLADAASRSVQEDPWACSATPAPVGDDGAGSIVAGGPGDPTTGMRA
jgi:hypothetical protein